MTTLVIDVGQDIVSMFSAEAQCYAAYRGAQIEGAIRLITSADEIVTLWGDLYDLPQLGRFAGVPGPLAIAGRHTDVSLIY